MGLRQQSMPHIWLFRAIWALWGVIHSSCKNRPLGGKTKLWGFKINLGRSKWPQLEQMALVRAKSSLWTVIHSYCKN